MSMNLLRAQVQTCLLESVHRYLKLFIKKTRLMRLQSEDWSARQHFSLGLWARAQVWSIPTANKKTTKEDLAFDLDVHRQSPSKFFASSQFCNGIKILFLTWDRKVEPSGLKWFTAEWKSFYASHFKLRTTDPYSKMWPQVLKNVNINNYFLVITHRTSLKKWLSNQETA